MNNLKRIFSLVSCFVVSSVCGIFALLTTSNYSAIVDNIREIVGKHANISSWNVCVIVLVTIMFFLATCTLLFDISISKDDKVDKIVHLIAFVLNVLMVIAVVVIFAVLMYKKADWLYEVVTVSMSENLELDEIETINGFLNMLYVDCFVLLLISCVANICCSVISYGKYNKEYNEESDCDDVDNCESTENDIVKSEIEKLKKELELQDLKKEYESL